MVEGQLQREGEVIHVIVQRCYNLTKLLRNLTGANNENLPLLTLSRADEKTSPIPPQHKKTPEQQAVQKEIFPGGRNFK